jgi:hypothetical protein
MRLDGSAWGKHDLVIAPCAWQKSRRRMRLLGAFDSPELSRLTAPCLDDFAQHSSCSLLIYHDAPARASVDGLPATLHRPSTGKQN